jgi:hypothetical protein
MGATRNGIADADPGRRCIAEPVNAMPINAPRQERKRSGHLIATGAGKNPRSQKPIADLDKIGAGRGL